MCLVEKRLLSLPKISGICISLWSFYQKASVSILLIGYSFFSSYFFFFFFFFFFSFFFFFFFFFSFFSFFFFSSSSFVLFSFCVLLLCLLLLWVITPTYTWLYDQVSSSLLEWLFYSAMLGSNVSFRGPVHVEHNHSSVTLWKLASFAKSSVILHVVCLLTNSSFHSHLFDFC